MSCVWRMFRNMFDFYILRCLYLPIVLGKNEKQKCLLTLLDVPRRWELLPFEKRGHYGKLSWEENQKEPCSHTKKLICKGTKCEQARWRRRWLQTGHHAVLPDINKPSKLYNMLSAFVLWGKKACKADVKDEGDWSRTGAWRDLYDAWYYLN